MEQCLIYMLSGECTVRVFSLPEMTLPQSLLPEKAVFKGVGTVAGQACYLYAVKEGKKDGKGGKILSDKGLAEALLSVARRENPQEFTVGKNEAGWTLTAEELKETLF